MQALSLPIGRGFTGQCLDIGASDLASAIGGRVPDVVVTLEPARRLQGRGRRSKVRPCQLMTVRRCDQGDRTAGRKLMMV